MKYIETNRRYTWRHTHGQLLRAAVNRVVDHSQLRHRRFGIPNWLGRRAEQKLQKIIPFAPVAGEKCGKPATLVVR